MNTTTPCDDCGTPTTGPLCTPCANNHWWMWRERHNQWGDDPAPIDDDLELPEVTC